jgi:S-DNA-T family DNA segregation ATPase FtsK/SpoIIIE
MQYCVREMERRYDCLDKAGVRSIKTYNKGTAENGGEKMPYLVLIIDEFADLMASSGKEIEAAITRLAAMSRAVGIHLVLATQRPSADVITGLIKSNVPTRIAFRVASMTDSRIIIDSPGAEKLLGKGDMLYCGAGSPFPVRAQGAFVSEEDAENVAAHLKTLGEPDYIDIA